MAGETERTAHIGFEQRFCVEIVTWIAEIMAVGAISCASGYVDIMAGTTFQYTIVEQVCFYGPSQA